MTGYRAIAGELRAAILAGVHAPGQTIPTLDQLQARYGVNQETARRAVAVLTAEGLVVPVRRRGTVVRDRSPVRMGVERYADVLAGPGSLGPWETACAAQGIDGRTDLIEVTRSGADAELAALLDVPAGTAAVCRLQYMTAGASVAQIQHTWIRADLADGTALALPAKVVGGLYRELTRLGHAPASAVETVTARMPAPDEAAVLRLPAGSPVLAIDRTTRDQAGLVLTVARAVLAGDRCQAIYRQALAEG